MSDTYPSSTGTPAPAEGGQGPERSSEDGSRQGERWFDRLLSAVGLRHNASDLRESLEEVLSDEAEADEAFSKQERTLLRNILDLRETRVADVMVPRSEIDSLAEDSTLTEVMLAFARSSHSRMPVYRESLDDANAMIHIRDVMQYLTTSALNPDGETLDPSRMKLDIRLDEAGLLRPILSVPATMPAMDLLTRMQAARIQIALVIDEFGGVDGLASMEDIVETVVGDIEDEHDLHDDTEAVVRLDEGGWAADGSVELADVKAATGIDLEAAVPENEEVDTLAGFVVSLFGRIPAKGEVLQSEGLPGIRFEVLDADERRLKRIRLMRIAPEPEAESP